MEKMFLLGAGIALLAGSANAATVTPSNPDGWSAVNVAGGATVGIDGTYAPGGQSGALTFSGSGGSAKADYRKSWGLVAGRTLGNISELGYDLFRAGSSTAAAHLAPAFRLTYANEVTPGTYQTGYLIWEPVYNGYPTAGAGVPEDSWIDNDILAGNFWMRAFGPGRTIEQYSTDLGEWASGVTYSHPSGASHQLSANTWITGIEVGIGSGWAGTFDGAVDDVRIAFGNDRVSANFEVVAAGAVPEPATWGMMILGFGLVGATARRRRRATVAA